MTNNRDKNHPNKNHGGHKGKKNRPHDPRRNHHHKDDKTAGRREAGLPTREELISLIQESDKPLDKRDIARAFGVTGQDRTKLRIMLRDLQEEGAVEKEQTRTYKAPDALPERALIEIIGLDGDGELRAKPVEWHGKGPVPIIYVIDKKRSEGYVNPGDKILAKLKRIDKLEYEARILKTLAGPAEKTQIVGTFKPARGGGWVYPTDKRNKEDYFIPEELVGTLQDGDLVIAEPMPASSKYPRSKNPARIVQFLGRKDDPRLISLIAIHSHGIPTEFSKDALKAAESFSEPVLDGRTDLRQYPLVTIDGADARDFDDAVFAEPDPDHPGGWHLIVAIADVSFYVRSGAPLDNNAFARGNSTYFADRVVPMLPERLSNDLCSLRPHVNRACLAVHLRIDSDARLTGWKFVRGLMRSAARLTYEQVQAAQDGSPDDTTGPLMDSVIKPLYKAYASLKRARELRGALELDLPERKAIIDKNGFLTAIVPRTRLAAHQLIEEFMILANVAAAEALEAKQAPCVYRVHDRPSYDKLEATREFLKEFGYSLPKSDHLHPRNINQILKLSAESDDKALVHTVLLRTQSQAIYSPDNLGHFGLALEKYAHFTSPIRRYADLLVHRSLVRAYKLGEGGLTDDEAGDLHNAAEHISFTERRSMMAERDVMDRFTAQFLSANIGKEFKGRISSVTRFGLFVQLEDTGADGIVPMSHLPRDYYVHDEKRHALVGKDSGREYRLSEPVIVRLVEADPLRGSTVFELLDGFRGDGTDAPRRLPKGGHHMGRGKGKGGRPDFRQDQRRRDKGKRGGKKRRG